MKGWFTLKFVRKLVAALTATTLVAISGLSSVCMAAREFDYISEYNRQSKLICEYSLNMLKSIDKSTGFTKGGPDGNYFKKDKLSDEEKKIYDQIVNEANKIKQSIPQQDSDYEIKLARSIFFWIRNNITYDKTSVNLGHDQEGMQIFNSNRKAQDALSVFKAREGVCAGVADLARVFMREAGLPCMMVCNYDHKFNAVWLDSLGGWALFDATCTEEMRIQELKASKNSKSGVSQDVIAMDDNFTAVAEPEKYSLEENNKYFMSRWGANHHVYSVYDLTTGFTKFSLELNGAAYIPLPKFIAIKSDNNSIIIDEDALSMNENCKIEGNVENIQNFDVFIKNFVKVDAARSHIRKMLQKDGVEFSLSCDGKQSKLSIKPLNGSVSCDTVTIPDELVPFLADIDKFDVDSNIKTVKYDLLRKGHALKEKAVPNGVKFEQIDS